MAYDTIKLRSPSLNEQLIKQIESQCFLRSGLEMSTGELRYEIFTGELLGSWDSRISVIPKYEEYRVNASGYPVLQRCEPYILIEGSVHKIFQGHNVYGGPTDFQKAASDFVCLIEQLLDISLPPANYWTVHRVDVALVYRLSKSACKEFFSGMQLINFPRRKKGAAKYDMAVYFAGKTTTVKFYHKGTEFAVHDRSRLKGFFQNLFAHIYGKNDLQNFPRVKRKIEALQRLADNRLRGEVEIHSDKFQYDFGKNPLVSEVTDAYLQGVYDTEVEKILREGKRGMDKVRNSRAVRERLRQMYGDLNGDRLHGFWSTLATEGDEYTKRIYPKASFYRHRKHLEEAGVCWRSTDLVIVANDGALPFDFAPIRSDKRLCYLPARSRDGYNVSRDQLRKAA